mgnify:CR=1 FL=1
MGRHAYLITAHNQFEILEKLLLLLDDPRNDIYIHVDGKAGMFDSGCFAGILKYSSAFFVPRIHVHWGGYSQIEATLILLRESVKNGTYSYYHFISGVDLPLKTQNYIHCFFDKRQGTEFVGFDAPVMQKRFYSRFQIYHIYQDRIGRQKSPLYYWEELLVYMQKRLRFRRIKSKDIIFQKGCNWFSITDDLARYILSKKKFISSAFAFSRCCDEIFIHTLIMNSDFKNRIYQKTYGTDNGSSACMRFVNFKYKDNVFRTSDYDKLISSELLFARKFNVDTDRNIVEKIYRHVKMMGTE